VLVKVLALLAVRLAAVAGITAAPRHPAEMSVAPRRRKDHIGAFLRKHLRRSNIKRAEKNGSVDSHRYQRGRAVWVYLTAGVFASLGLITWAGVVSWAIFYAAGGGVAALRKSIGSILTGNFYAAIALFAFAHTGGGIPVLALSFGIVTFFMYAQARFEPLSFIPGTFLGAGT
jgi:hypothetical protein